MVVAQGWLSGRFFQTLEVRGSNPIRDIIKQFSTRKQKENRMEKRPGISELSLSDYGMLLFGNGCLGLS